MADRELVIDSFAGGGGASLGIAWALGRGPDVAINHDAAAIAMHAANHPETRHVSEDVWKTAPRQVTRGRPVGLLWASPDCKHFSRAKGGKPVEKRIRSLAWVVVRWADQCRPRVVILENVREFAEWGPLVPRWSCAACGWKGTEGQAVLARKRRRCPRCESVRLAESRDLVPDPSRKGLTFRRWVGRLKALGYAVEWRVLNAADYGAPTHRRRLFLVARCDGKPIVWPEPTHGDPKKLASPGLFAEVRQPWRTAAECIDWSLPCPSIFLTRQEGRAVGVNRPLAENTLRRIALGIKRYVLDAPRPFLVVCNHGGPEFRGQDLGGPLPTIAASRDAHGLVAATLIQTGYSERSGQSPRTLDLGKPMGTAVGGVKQALVTSFLAPMTHDNRAVPPGEPLPTITTQYNRCPLVAAFLAKHYGGQVGQRAGAPLPTTVSRGTQTQVVAANLIHLNNNTNPSGVGAPLHTATGAGNHAALVYSFLIRYFGTSIGQHLAEPLYTVTGKDRFGYVTVTIDAEPFVIVDIGMRMLAPRELARGQGLPDDYVLTGTATSQVARIGNSVPPVMAKVLTGANYSPRRAATLVEA
jgi:DNA (cytosine-5)-methyltransferase 1